MARGPCTFRQRDVTAAIRAALDAGVQVARVEVNADGKIVMIIGKIAETAKNEWDEEFDGADQTQIR
jgi:hypothetical protein